MKLSFIFLTFFSFSYAQADTTVFFPSGDGIVLIQGQDSDASDLFNAMAVAPTEQSGVLKKHISMSTMSSDPVFDLSCNKAKLTGTASCTFKIFPALASINKNQKSILLGINDQYDAPAIASSFLHASGNPYQGEVFYSVNRKLRIWKTFDSTGKVVSFTAQYQEQ